MQTDRWYLERRIYLAAGINISVASVLSLVHSPWWLLFTGFSVGAAQNQFWGDRIAWLMDPSGHVWTVATRIEETTAQERTARWE